MSGPVGVPEPGIGIIDELATALMDQWAESEPEHSITKNPVSYVATFVELARAAYLIVAARVRVPLVELAGQWEDLLATQSEIMTTPQSNAWRDALAELRGALLGVAATDGQAPSLRHDHDAHARVEERRRVAALIRKNAATLDSFAREGSTAGLIAYLIDNVMAADVPVVTPPEPKLPHSRACGWREHPHGPQCAVDCPTCSAGVARYTSGPAGSAFAEQDGKP